MEVPQQFVSRRRLLQRLSSPTRLICISAPAGYGKSALVREYAKAAGERCASVSGRGRGRAELWFDIAVRLDVVHPGNQTAGSEPDDWIDAVALVDEPATVIVDDVPPAPAFAHDILRLLESTSLLRVVLTNRHPERFTALAAASPSAVEMIEAADLAFTSGEAARLQSQLRPTSPLAVPDSISPLRWRMALLGGQDLDDSRSAERYLDFVLATQDDPDELLSAFGRLAFSPVLSDSFVRSTVGADHPARLALAEELALGRWTGPDEFEFSPEIRAALRHRRAELGSDETRAWVRRDALWALENGYPWPALDAALEINDLYLASRVIRTSWEGLVDSPAAAALQRVPVGDRSRFPAMNLMVGLHYLAAGNKDSALPMFDLAAESIRKNVGSAEPGEQLWLLGMLTAALRLQGRLTGAVRAAARAEALVQTYPERALIAEPGTSRLIVHFALSFMNAGQVDRAEAMLTLGLRCNRPGTAGWFHCLSVMAGVVALSGRLHDAAELLRVRSDTPHPARWDHSYLGFFGVLAESMLLLERGDSADARTTLSVLQPHLATVEHLPAAIAVECMIDLAEGDHPRVRAVIDSALLERAAPYWRGVLVAESRLAWLLAGVPSPASSRPQSPLGRVLSALESVIRDDAGSALVTLADIAATDGVAGVSPRVQAMAAAIGVAAADAAGADFVERLAADAGALLSHYGLSTPLAFAPDRVQAVIARHIPGGAPSWPYRFPVLEELPTLSRRELEILFALTRCRTREELADQLQVSINTIKTQLRSVYRKLGVSSRGAALARASELRLIAGPRQG
ncbi:helix-turn-helix transcriptional regulator [Leifsonia aquatica]|uniref:helix-turn-helix transcriptional regulator n=1 Tax=Leifsonia aquatica TaxID=144185 RepID=UPI0028B135E6|nr:LuxR C-terminal-related transcriptional regulator [Leifsonia aquatica]